MVRILGIIPARFASTRFPGKPLADLAGHSMIERVYRQVKKSKHLHQTIVATDDKRIEQHVHDFGGEVMMTSQHHVSGTDRCFEVLKNQKSSFDYVINIQGDEPFIDPDQIDQLAGILDGTVELGTLVKQIEKTEHLFNPNVVKAVVNKLNEALYFSRSPIPHIRNEEESRWLAHGKFYKHIGMYAYRSDILEKITQLPVSHLEKSESLEQLRWLENGFRIKVAETEMETIGIDTPDDLKKAIEFLNTQKA